MIIVNTVVLVQSQLGLGQRETAWALAAFGGGSMIAAFVLPRVLDRLPDRVVMLSAASMLPIALVGMTMIATYPLILLLWLATGFAYASAQTPSGRLLKRSSNDDTRPALFAAHFAASHACWLICYPLAGWLGAFAGLDVTALVLSAIAAMGVMIAFAVWPAADPGEIEHEHPELPDDHPHLLEHSRGRHRHAFVVDDHHLHWPR